MRVGEAQGPGPQVGARLEIAYPILPLAEGVGLTVGAMTWEGRLSFGLTADAAIVPDLDRLADAIRSAFDELALAAGVRWGEGSADQELEAVAGAEA